MGILWPHSNTIVRNNSDARVPGAKAYFFEAGTTTPRTTYSDAALNLPRTHPVLADGNGRLPAIFLDYGDYRERVRTAGDTTLWDTDDIPNPTPVSDEDDVDPNAIFQTGDIIFTGKNGTRDGFVRCNGRTLGSATSGATERANPDCEDLFLYVWNNYANGQSAVSGGRDASAAADWAANKTIALPDHRAAALIGFDNMGNSAAGLVASAPVVSGSGILAGSIIGANTHALTTAQLATHLHSVAITSQTGPHAHALSGNAIVSGESSHTHTGTTGSGGVDHTHAYTAPTANTTIGYQAGASSDTSADDTAPGQITNGASAFLHTHGFTTGSGSSHTHNMSGTTDIESAHNHNVVGNTGNNGSGDTHNILQRSIPVTVLMKL